MLPQAKVVPVSAIQSFNIGGLFDRIVELLPEGEPYYPEDTLTDRTMRFFASEIIREKIFLNYDKEVPYSTEVVIEEYKESTAIDRISALIYCSRQSQKGILIGHRGQMLKKVGTEARIELEKFLGKKVYLDILKQHPLNRAMRIDKMTLAALEATLRSYEAGTPEEIPVIAMLSASPEALRPKAERLAAMLATAGIATQIIPTEGYVGGGSVPNQRLSSWAVALGGNAAVLEEALRKGTHPVIGRIHEGKFLLDVRTLRETDFETIVCAVREAVE